MVCNGNIELTDKRRILIFLNLVVSGIATSILSTAMTTALPSLVTYFLASVLPPDSGLPAAILWQWEWLCR